MTEPRRRRLFRTLTACPSFPAGELGGRHLHESRRVRELHVGAEPSLHLRLERLHAQVPTADAAIRSRQQVFVPWRQPISTANRALVFDPTPS